MSFKLKVEFVGVCMFVPDPGTNLLYVLMPGEHGHHHGEPHVVRLCVDTAYLVPNSPGKSGITALVAMDGVDLEFEAPLPPAAGFPPPLPCDVVKIGAMPERSISREALAVFPGSHLLSGRARLYSGAPLDPLPGSGVCWTYECSVVPRRLVNRMWWTMEIEKASLTLLTTPLTKDFPVPEIPALHPIDGVIEVSLYHTPLGDLPPNVVTQPHRPERGSPANHFTAYYSLFKPKDAIVPIPTFWGDTCGGVPEGSGGSPYTCMLAQSPPLEPEM